jgi:4-hydroxybenzoate polyprenyltransferase
MTLKALYIYQKERFPVLKNGLLILILSLATLCFSKILQNDFIFPSVKEITVVFIIMFVFFLQLRIADEFKDFEEDSRYRPYRPVPRGIVTLTELRNAGIAGFLIQFLLILLFNRSVLIIFFVVYLYMFFMTKEFFVPEWLNGHQAVYMLSHMIIMVLFHLFIIIYQFRGLPRGNYGIYIFIYLIIGFLNGMCGEIGRKIRAPEDEENGVITYSKIWGIKKSVFIFVFIQITNFLLCIITAVKINSLFITAGFLGTAAVVTLIKASEFIKNKKNGDIFEKLSGVWILAVYLTLGILPLIKG